MDVFGDLLDASINMFTMDVHYLKLLFYLPGAPKIIAYADKMPLSHRGLGIEMTINYMYI